MSDDEQLVFATATLVAALLLTAAFAAFVIRSVYELNRLMPVQSKEDQLVLRQVLQEFFEKERQAKADAERRTTIKPKPPSWLRIKPRARGRSTKRAT